MARRSSHTGSVTRRRDAEPDALALLAHELRTPLTALLGYAEAMRDAAFGPVNPPYDEHAAVIHRAAIQLLALLDDMTDVAAAEAGVWKGARERFDAGRLAHEIVTLFRPRADAAGIAIRILIPESLGEVLAARRAVAQILTNLLDNALKFTRRGGAVTLSLAREDHDLRLEVADSGSADGPAFRQPRGHGLGLRLVQALCMVHGGRLQVEPRPTGGLAAVARLAVFELG